jgi:uncharacterized protein YciI
VYALVLLTDHPQPGEWAAQHDSFVDSLVERRLVLLGGPLTEAGSGGPHAAYVLRCASLADAQEVVATDPLVSSGAATAAVLPWDLVGIDPRIIDPDLVVGKPGA